MSKKISIGIVFFLLSSILGHYNYYASADEEIPEWGFYVYMAGDNTLYNELTDDLNEMKMVGSNDNLEIVALTDKMGDNDSHMYHVLKHNLVEYNLSMANDTWQNELDPMDIDYKQKKITNTKARVDILKIVKKYVNETKRFNGDYGE